MRRTGVPDKHCQSVRQAVSTGHTAKRHSYLRFLGSLGRPTTERRTHAVGDAGPRIVLPHRYGNRGRSGTRPSVFASAEDNPGSGSRGALLTRILVCSRGSTVRTYVFALRKGGPPYRTGGEIVRILVCLPRKNTVLDGNLARDLARPYRTQREVLPFLPGKNSVLVGK